MRTTIPNAFTTCTWAVVLSAAGEAAASTSWLANGSEAQPAAEVTTQV
ncbi:hypothetical protein [Hymenobacter rubidus]|nr:hypothetical protein [Hymenobacter rubidus]